MTQKENILELYSCQFLKLNSLESCIFVFLNLIGWNIISRYHLIYPFEIKNLPISKTFTFIMKMEQHDLGLVCSSEAGSPSSSPSPPCLLCTWKIVRKLYSRLILGMREWRMKNKKILVLKIQ